MSLVWRLPIAAHAKDRRRADRLLVEASRWLEERAHDAVVSEARDELGRAFPPDPEDKAPR